MNGKSPVPVVEELDLARLVTPYQSRKMPVYRWYNLNHSYSKDLILRLLQDFKVPPQSTVLDPFCGTGTTMLCCRDAGMNAVGVDIMPLSTFASRSKIMYYDCGQVERDFGRIFPGRQYDFGFETAAPYLQKCFPLEELTRLLHLRYSILQMENPCRSFFALALLGILKQVSYTKNDGAFIRFCRDEEPDCLEETFPAQVKMMLNDIRSNGDERNGNQFPVIRGDARNLPLADNLADCLITSPPYLNRHDYTRIYAVELLFSFLDDNEQLKKLRYKMLRSNVEARRTVESSDYEPPPRLAELLAKLEKCRLPNRKVLDMIAGYFEDMYLVLKEAARVLKRGAKAAFVVRN